jgi:hypothetical protein
MNSSKITQRNHVIDHLDEEFDDFITAQVESSQGLIANFKKPTGKELTETRKHSKSLIELAQTWYELNKLIDENTYIGTIGAIKYNFFQTVKPSAKYATNQKNILKLATKYVDLKKKYISKYLN